MVRRILVWRVLPVVALATAGGLMFALGRSSGVVNVIGLFLLMVAGLLVVSFVFLEVGLSEDRERAHDEAESRARREQDPHPERRPRRGRPPRGGH